MWCYYNVKNYVFTMLPNNGDDVVNRLSIDRQYDIAKRL